MNRTDRATQWYSFGASGFGTAQEYEIIRHYVLDYSPALVIMLFVDNDVWDCSPYLSPIAPWYPTYCLDEDGELELMPSRTPLPQAPVRAMIKRSALARYLFLQHGFGLRLPQGNLALRKVYLREDALQGELSAVAKGLAVTRRKEKSWELIERLLKACREQCSRRGATFALAYRGNVDLLDNAGTGSEYQPQPPERDPFCLTDRIQLMGRERLEPISRRLGIPYLDLTEPLQRVEIETGCSFRFPNDYHYSAAGHEAVGEALAKWAERLLTDRSAEASPRAHVES